MINDAIQLLKQANDESGFVSVVDEQHVRNYLQNDAVIVMVWHDGDTPAGLFIGVCTEDWCEPVKKLYEHIVYVAPQYRSSGLGKQIMESVIELAEVEGAEYIIGGITLDINKDAASELYEMYDFKEFGKTVKRKV